MKNKRLKCKKCEELVKKKDFLTLDYDKGIIILGEFAFHMQDTHGIPVELLPDLFKITWEKTLGGKVGMNNEGKSEVCWQGMGV